MFSSWEIQSQKYILGNLFLLKGNSSICQPGSYSHIFVHYWTIGHSLHLICKDFGKHVVDLASWFICRILLCTLVYTLVSVGQLSIELVCIWRGKDKCEKMVHVCWFSNCNKGMHHAAFILCHQFWLLGLNFSTAVTGLFHVFGCRTLSLHLVLHFQNLCNSGSQPGSQGLPEESRDDFDITTWFTGWCKTFFLLKILIFSSDFSLLINSFRFQMKIWQRAKSKKVANLSSTTKVVSKMLSWLIVKMDKNMRKTPRLTNTRISVSVI